MIKLALEYEMSTTLKEVLKLPSELLAIKPAIGGHMAYSRLLVAGPRDSLFVKAYDPDQFTDDVRREHSLVYLKKEQLFYDHLRANGFNHIPNRTELIDGEVLAMDALKTGDGWHWRIPTDQQQSKKYLLDIFTALDDLAKIPVPDMGYNAIPETSYQILWKEGWNCIDDRSLARIKTRIKQLSVYFDKGLQQTSDELLSKIDELRVMARQFKQHPTKDFVLAHNDARQANIAWHPDHGAVLVDWSWADAAPQKADSTMLLIDLAKSGHDVREYISDRFDPDYALVLLGFWLANSLRVTHDGTDTIRAQQLASAVNAYMLIKNPNRNYSGNNACLGKK